MEIAPDATGLYTVGSHILWAGETLNQRAGNSGWKATSKELRPMAAEKVNIGSIALGTEANIMVLLPGVSSDNSNGLVVTANGLRTRRAGIYTVGSQLFINYCPDGTLIEVKLYVDGKIYKNYAVTIASTSLGGVDKTLALPANATVELGVYYYNPSGAASGETIAGGCFLSLTEHV